MHRGVEPSRGVPLPRRAGPTGSETSTNPESRPAPESHSPLWSGPPRSTDRSRRSVEGLLLPPVPLWRLTPTPPPHPQTPRVPDRDTVSTPRSVHISGVKENNTATNPVVCHSPFPPPVTSSGVLGPSVLSWSGVRRVGVVPVCVDNATLRPRPRHPRTVVPPVPPVGPGSGSGPGLEALSRPGPLQPFPGVPAARGSVTVSRVPVPTGRVGPVGGPSRRAGPPTGRAATGRTCPA